MPDLLFSSALATCENEPIHAPGAIQPHGLLLALDPTTLLVLHVSENCPAAFGRGQAGLLGAGANELLGPAAVAVLQDALAAGGPDEPIPFPAAPGGTSGWHGLAHRRSDLLFLELEPAGGDSPLPSSLLFAERLAGWPKPRRSPTFARRWRGRRGT